MKQSIAFLLVVLLVPQFALARHNNSWSIDRDDLDDDVVDEFPIPVLFGVEYGEVYPDFGDPRGGGTREHEGEDFLAPLGTPIVSPTEAIVIRTGTGPSAGKYVYTANPGGETFRYMHLDEIADNLDRGDRLRPGDFIGTVGDTGNAPDGVYHLHFETRNEDNEAEDPYPRLSEDTWTLKEKASFLEEVIDSVDDGEELAERLVANFGDELVEAYRKQYDLPKEIIEALEDAGKVTAGDALEQWTKLMTTIATLLPTGLSDGDTGPAVTLLQINLIYTSEGSARNALKAAGATGYFGPVTLAALQEKQRLLDVPESASYDAATKAAFSDSDDVLINLQ